MTESEIMRSKIVSGALSKIIEIVKDLDVRGNDIRNMSREEYSIFCAINDVLKNK